MRKQRRTHAIPDGTPTTQRPWHDLKPGDRVWFALKDSQYIREQAAKAAHA